MDEDQGGDPVCWLDQVCDNCGGFVGRGHAHLCRQILDAPAPAPAPAPDGETAPRTVAP